VVVRTVRALAGSCHPLPSVAVTAFGTALAAAAGNGAGTCVLVAVAVLAGQLSIGWSNDRIDVRLDRAAGRLDKPVAGGAVPVRAVEAAIAAAVAVCVAGSLALGWRAGLLHLGAVSCGWLYNLGLKATVVSWLPYAAAFGSLPGVATLALPSAPGPAAWAVAAGALLGVAAHLTNALPDLAADRAFGVAGLPHRIGARASVVLAAAGLLAGTAVLVLAPRGGPSAFGVVAFAVAAAWAVGGSAVAWRRPGTSRLFLGTIVVAALDVVLLLAGPSFT
jgi:4-hydroxybenzoate polyprenyltransferase